MTIWITVDGKNASRTAKLTFNFAAKDQKSNDSKNIDLAISLQFHNQSRHWLGHFHVLAANERQFKRGLLSYSDKTITILNSASPEFLAVIENELRSASFQYNFLRMLSAFEAVELYDNFAASFNQEIVLHLGLARYPVRELEII